MDRKLQIFAALAILLLFLSGCSRFSLPSSTTSQNTVTAVTAAPQLQDQTLTMLRQAMAGTPELFAVAYLGQIDEPTDIPSYIRQSNPQLLQNYPFIGQIPQERILGTTGEIYCIIPRDKSAKIQVVQSAWLSQDLDSSKTIYQTDSGSPFILLCNYMDCHITIRASAGDTVSWSPGIDDSFTISLPWDRNGSAQAWDISLYEAGPRDIYHKWYQEGWTMPYEETLDGTQWIFTGTGPDGREAQCQLILNRNGTASLSWQYAGSPTQEYYHGTWNAWLEHRAFLRLELRRTGGVLHTAEASIADSFAVLLSPEGDRLLLGFSYYGTGLPLEPVEKDVLAIFEAFGR